MLRRFLVVATSGIQRDQERVQLLQPGAMIPWLLYCGLTRALPLVQNPQMLTSVSAIYQLPQEASVSNAPLHPCAEKNTNTKVLKHTDKEIPTHKHACKHFQVQTSNNHSKNDNLKLTEFPTIKYQLITIHAKTKCLSECCWSPKILTKIECCGSKFSHEYDMGGAQLLL